MNTEKQDVYTRIHEASAGRRPRRAGTCKDISAMGWRMSQVAQNSKIAEEYCRYLRKLRPAKRFHIR